MQTINLVYDAEATVNKRAHVGIVASGDLEVLIEPSNDSHAYVKIRTSVDGYGDTWEAVLNKLFIANRFAVNIEINDFGATPGVVLLRLEQAMEVIKDEA